MNILGENIKTLRKQRGLTQEELGQKMGVNRSMIGSYEEGRAIPKLQVLQAMAHYFGTTIDSMLCQAAGESQLLADTAGKTLRVLTTLTDRNDNELITVVPAKASAGYLTGYADPDYIGQLPAFSLPLPELSQHRTFRAFQIQGDSMEPIPQGSYIIAEYVQNWNDIKDGKTYVLATRDEGIVYKRIYNRIEHDAELDLVSDNPEYKPYVVKIDQVLDVWRAVGYISFSLPDSQGFTLGRLSAMMLDLRQEIEVLKARDGNTKT